MPSIGQAALCARDDVPAASLLLPWFEASVDCSVQATRNTELTISNASPQSRLSRVTLWSNAAVPVLSFDVYFGGYAQQTIDMRALLCSGTLPSTGVGLSAPGRHAEPENNFPNCNSGTDPAAGAPVYAALTEARRAELRAVLSGNPHPSTGMCSGIVPEVTGTAVGYVTVDAVSECSALAHGQDAFYAVLANANVFTGNALLLNTAENQSVSVPVLSLEADAGGKLVGSNSFYGSISVGQNLREPLPVAWQVDIDQREGARADLLVFRAPERARAPFACASGPATLPLDLSNSTGFGSRGWYIVDDAGKAYQPGRRNPFPLNAQRVSAVQASSELAALAGGMAYVNLSHTKQLATPDFAPQGWIGSIIGRTGRFATMSSGVPVSAACDAAPFNNTPPPPRRVL